MSEDNYTPVKVLIKWFLGRMLETFTMTLHCYAALGIINGS